MTRVLLVDDHPMFLNALKLVLLAEDGFEVVGQEADGQGAVRAARELNPDVIVMDIHLRDMTGIEATREILAENPFARVLVITGSHDADTLTAAIQTGAMGCVLKDEPSEHFLEALQQVAQGKKYLPPGISQKILESLLQSHSALAADEKKYNLLSDREKEVLQLIGEGLSNADIAGRFNLSPSTIRVHIYSIRAKLQLGNRNQMLLFALKRNPKAG